MGRIAKEHDDFDVTVRWIPGHEGVHSNEEVDKQAKRAAEGDINNSTRAKLPHFLRHGTLPLSISALIQSQHDSSCQRWIHLWKKSPRYPRTHCLDPNLLKISFIKLTATYPKRLTSLLMSLHTQHVPLNKHFHRLSKSETPSCPHCHQTKEYVHHFLFDCPHYLCECHALSVALGRKATSLPYLLMKENAILHLVSYVNSTKQLKTTFGELSTRPKCQN
ncbi:hypothetical protein EV702DRAFT_975753 [Suillus placidus]|uniref:RNase H type-1 domain-containing protein n=1 Tax=Suillus placidus TaxID=48579 RepID=A0A9P6ZNP5_9AGAM|nr:hypothetical protein EV702DRAFT_975753 [Suillus placidus]